MEAREHPPGHLDCCDGGTSSTAVVVERQFYPTGGRRVQTLSRSSACHRRRLRRGGRGAEANCWFVEHLGKIGGQRGWGDGWRDGRGRERWMGPPGQRGWCRRQARCPGAHTPLATGGELRQSRPVLVLLRLGEHLPALAWGMAGDKRGGLGKRDSGERSGCGAGAGRGR